MKIWNLTKNLQHQKWIATLIKWLLLCIQLVYPYFIWFIASISWVSKVKYKKRLFLSFFSLPFVCWSGHWMLRDFFFFLYCWLMILGHLQYLEKVEWFRYKTWTAIRPCCPRINITQRKLLNFEKWCTNGEGVKKGQHLTFKVNFLFQNHQNLSHFLSLTFLDNINFWVTLLIKWCLIFDSSHYTNPRNSIISFEYVDS